jgi:hypothetical protein
MEQFYYYKMSYIWVCIWSRLFLCMFFFWIYLPHMRENMCPLCFWSWLTSLNMMSSNCMHSLSNHTSLSLLAE